MNTKMTYAGFYHDKHGMTMLARVVLDGWLFGLLPESEDCAGWQLGQMQTLADKIEAEWTSTATCPAACRPTCANATKPSTAWPRNARAEWDGTPNSAKTSKSPAGKSLPPANPPAAP